jgi:hypothetical protein
VKFFALIWRSWNVGKLECCCRDAILRVLELTWGVYYKFSYASDPGSNNKYISCFKTHYPNLAA